MGFEEAAEVIKAISVLDFPHMEVQDQAMFMLFTDQFAERIKPLIVKYADKLPEKTTFLFKM